MASNLAFGGDILKSDRLLKWVLWRFDQYDSRLHNEEDDGISS
jgi:hypothetical protein